MPDCGKVCPHRGKSKRSGLFSSTDEITRGGNCTSDEVALYCRRCRVENTTGAWQGSGNLKRKGWWWHGFIWFPGGPRTSPQSRSNKPPGILEYTAVRASNRSAGWYWWCVCVWRGGVVVVVRFAGLDKRPQSSDDSQIDSTAGMWAAPHNHQPTVRSDRKTTVILWSYFPPILSPSCRRSEEKRLTTAGGKNMDTCGRKELLLQSSDFI